MRRLTITFGQSRAKFWTYDNLCQIDIEAQKKYLNDHSVDTSKMNDVQIAEANTGSSLFVCSNIKLVDAMEDFIMVNYV